MRLAIVTSFPPSKVTLNEYAFHLVKHFRQKRELTELILLTDKTKEEKVLSFNESGCKITIKECWTFNSYLNLITVTKAINKVQPDAILFNLQFMKFGDKKIPAALGLMLPLVCRLKRIPNIVLLHNILEQVDLNNAGFTANKILQKGYEFIGTILTKLILKADLVGLTMQKYVGILEEKYKAKNVVFIPHGTFEISKEPQYTLDNGPLKVMTFGKFGTYKRVEMLIEAIQEVRKSTHKNIEVVIAGTDSPNALGYLKFVKNKYKHVPQINFTGYVDESDVPKIFQESAVVVFPYTSTTGSSGVLHQAGSYGKAVIMPNLGDLALLVKHEGYRGEFFTPDSINSLAKAIESIILDDAYRIHLGMANYRAATAFPMSKITEMYLNKFQEIISNKNTISRLEPQRTSH
ncbi:glycosyl transferase family 1 [Flavobacteriales bacterium 34_180_T64]|nr:glycosyl transferase family 1 [Flavobacteriales bacterium 34_180_T64]